MTALASDKHMSELYALISKGLSWNDDKTNITLRVAPEFVAKNQLGQGQGAILPIRL